MKAYSVNLREKIVAPVGRRVSKAQVAHTFGVGATSVKRYVKMTEKGESLAVRKAPGRERKLDEVGMKRLGYTRKRYAGATCSAGFLAKHAGPHGVTETYFLRYPKLAARP